MNRQPRQEYRLTLGQMVTQTCNSNPGPATNPDAGECVSGPVLDGRRGVCSPAGTAAPDTFCPVIVESRLSLWRARRGRHVVDLHVPGLRGGIGWRKPIHPTHTCRAPGVGAHLNSAMSKTPRCPDQRSGHSGRDCGRHHHTSEQKPCEFPRTFLRISCRAWKGTPFNLLLSELNFLRFLI